MSRRVSAQLADYHGEYQKKGLRHFAINIGHSSLPFVWEQTRVQDSTFLNQIPKSSALEEMVLFESFRPIASGFPKIKRLELDDLGSKEQGKRMKYAQRALKTFLKKKLGKNGDVSGGVTPLIRICKIDFELI